MAAASSANNNNATAVRNIFPLSDAAVRTRYFHPQHMLALYLYSDASTYPCAACELVVTGAGYRCDECDFNIHKVCIKELRSRISFTSGQQRKYTLTFTRVGGQPGVRPLQRDLRRGALHVPLRLAAAGLLRVCVLTSSTCFHPQHLLRLYKYEDEHAASASATTHPCCDACGRRVTGIEYRCGEECDFHIHRDCLRSFSGSIDSFPEHPRHTLTLTCCLTDGTRRCDLCKETSRAGFYMYLCEPCNYSLHPLCMVGYISRQPPPAAPAPPAPQPIWERPRALPLQQPNREWAHRAVHSGLHVLHTAHHVAHTAHTVHKAVDMVPVVNALASAGKCAIM